MKAHLDSHVVKRVWSVDGESDEDDMRFRIREGS